ncbi:MAG: hypothetical protein AB7L84_11515 [Acidimicrobiia bacterium]
MGAFDRAYRGFTDGDGRQVPPGSTFWAEVASPEAFPSPVIRLKCDQAQYDTLVSVGFGAQVEGVARPFARSGRIEYRLIELAALSAAA